MTDEKAAGGVERDLLGDPVTNIRDPRGRRSAVGSAGIRKEVQRVIMSLRAAGQSQEQIGEYLQMDVKTLRKYFSRELDHGATLLEGLAMQVLVKRMLDGSVSAAKQVMTVAGLRSAPKATKPEARKPEPLGKKERLNRDAKVASGDWGDILPGIDRPN